jgi:hypothetical protein
MSHKIYPGRFSQIELHWLCLSLIPMMNGQNLLTGQSSASAPVFRQEIVTAFEAGEPIKTLPCSVAPQKPLLGLDLAYHSGYLITIPTMEMAISRNRMGVIFRVISKEQPGRPTYFGDHIVVPPLDENAPGTVEVAGEVLLGEGSYHLDLVVYDSVDRFCSASWDVTAALPESDKPITLALPSGAVDARRHLFAVETAVPKGVDTLKVKVLANFVPRSKSSGAMPDIDQEALVSILRALGRDPKVGSISLVAFDLYEERIIYRQDSVTRLDFPSLGKALATMNPGTVAVEQLANRNSSGEFLADLIDTELGVDQIRPDAVVFIGPKAFIEGKVPMDHIPHSGSDATPVFYLNYVHNPQETPWRDTIGNVVKRLRGLEFNVTRPRDIWNALSVVISRAAASRSALRFGRPVVH